MYACGVRACAHRTGAATREIALAGSRRLRSTLAVAPVLFAHAVVTSKTVHPPPLFSHIGTHMDTYTSTDIDTRHADRTHTTTRT
jgi:hypothetical protein